MRLLLSLCLLVSGAACAGPHSTGALWAQQYAEQERTFFALTEVQRRDRAEEFERGLADEGLAAERERINTLLKTCPGARVVLQPSAGDARRDAIRIQAEADTSRLEQVARLALADWYLRRASASGDQRLCAQAQAARDGMLAAPATADLLDRAQAATVSRDQRQAGASASTDPPLVTLSRYVLGATDTVQAAAPLPQYLAWVYGGFLLTSATPVDAETAAALVDAQAPAFSDWEPDALYAALRS